MTAAKKSRVKGKQSVLSAEFVASSDNDDLDDTKINTPNQKLALSGRERVGSRQESKTTWTIQEELSLGTKEVILDNMPSASNRAKPKALHQARNFTHPTSTNAVHGQMVVRPDHEGKQSTALENLSPIENRGCRSNNEGGPVAGSGRKILLAEGISVPIQRAKGPMTDERSNKDDSDDPDDPTRGTRVLAESDHSDQQASLSPERLTALRDESQEPHGRDHNRAALNNPEAHATKAISVSSEDSSSESDSSEASDDWPNPSKPSPQVSLCVPPDEFQLPSGFVSSPVVLAKLFAGPKEGEGLLSPRVFTSGELPAHKQIWHISIPSLVPITLIDKFGKHEILQGDAGTSYKGLSYHLHVAAAPLEHILLPGPGNRYRSLPCETLRTLHLQQSPRNVDSQQSTAGTITKRPKVDAEGLPNGQQPEGLKMRYQPFGHLARKHREINSNGL